jgi:hypothetical protein
LSISRTVGSSSSAVLVDHDDLPAVGQQPHEPVGHHRARRSGAEDHDPLRDERLSHGADQRNGPARPGAG